MDRQQVNGIAQQFIAELHAIEEGDTAGVDRIVEMFADNAKLSNPIIERDGSERSGREQIADFWRNYCTSFREIHSDFFEVTASDHAAGLFWRSSGTDANGQPLSYEGVSLLTLDNAGKILQFKGFFDSRQVTIKH